MRNAQEGLACQNRRNLAPKAGAFLKAKVLGLLILLTIPCLEAADLVHLAEREQIRRQENLKKADRLITRAERARKDKNLKEAYKDYIEALSLIPAGSATAAERQSVINDFSGTAVAYARDLIARGNYADAENVAKTVLSPEFNPTYKPAANLLAQLEKGNFNTTLDPKFASTRDEVEKLLNEAEGYYGTGRFDLATRRYEQVLNLDKYNTAARNGMELVNKQRTTYYDETYNETRSRLLWLVDRTWERPVRKLGKSGRASDTALFLDEGAPGSKDAIINKLNSITLDRVELDDVSIREAVEFLKQKSRELDKNPEVAKRGVNIVLKIPATTSAIDAVESSLPGEEPGFSPGPIVTENTKITMSLRNVPLIEAIRYLTELAGLKSKIEPFAVSIVPITENTDELFTKEYRVSPGFIPSTATVDAGPTLPGQSVTGSNQRITGVRNATEYLKQQGVPFPTGSFAQYIPSGSKLIVRNTQGALDLVDTLVEGDMGVPPTQVEIEAKFIEISQNNLNELGFDWLLGPFSIGGGVYGDGGTRSAGDAVNYANFPYGSLAGNPITAGNRSGIGTSVNSAITANSIDALVAGVPQGANVASPGVLGIAGVFTNPQFQMVIRALSQQKGVDLMSAPKVVTKSGNKATIKIIREFPFPIDFNPPEVPDTNNNLSVSNNQSGIVSTSSLVTPATPAAWDKKDLGVTLEVEPQVGSDNYTIDLSLKPEIIDFDGFINYGSPIQAPRTLSAAQAAQEFITNPSGIGLFTLTDNVINQPIFSIRRVETSVSIWDGQTVGLGGLIREDVQKVNDKVPILGDIPLAGRLFRTSVDQKIKKNLIIFVTARLMDAEGQPLIQDDEAEEFVEPLGLPEDLPGPRVETQRLGK
jgi:general secretion pathway protein D